MLFAAAALLLPCAELVLLTTVYSASKINNQKLQNVVMQLRKAANHPYLFDSPIDPRAGPEVVDEGLVNASGKMLLLDRLLGGLFARKHKVLIFSQCKSPPFSSPPRTLLIDVSASVTTMLDIV